VRCLRHAIIHPSVLRRALVTALIVGTILGIINHGDHLIQGTILSRDVLKMALTYCVPFTVSTLGALGAARITNDDRETHRV
jgi:hypothetical protein